MKIKILISISLIYLFFSCAPNKTVSVHLNKNTISSEKRISTIDTKEFTITYPKTWREVENKFFTAYTIAPKKEIGRGFLAEDGRLPACYKGMSAIEIENAMRENGLDIPKTSVKISSIALNDTLTFKNVIANHLKFAPKKNYSIAYSKKELIKETEDYAIISGTTKLKSNKYAFNSLKHYMVKNNKVYIVAFSGSSNIYGKYLTDFSTILSSFKIKEVL